MSVTELLFPTSPLDVCYGFLKTLEQLVDLHCEKAKKKMWRPKKEDVFLFPPASSMKQAWLDHSPQQKLEWNSEHNFRPSTTAQLHKDCAVFLLLFLLCFYWDSFVTAYFIFWNFTDHRVFKNQWVFFLFINSKLYAVIVDENVVIVCFINSTRKKKWAWFDISSNERILTKVWFILIICTLWSFKFCDFNPSIVFWILINITYCLWNHFTSLSFL